jgi:hypothetical protein
MSKRTQNLYELLPAIYRIRDSKLGGQLKALFEVISREAGVVEDDIDQLYENWFIETCEEWVVPYIGELLGVRNLNSIESIPGFSMRTYVANTIKYRRRKGTAPVLEQLALDTTGWQARVVEFFNLLGTTQNLNHLRMQNITPPDLRDTNNLELINSAFDTVPHTADIRHINRENGWYNIPNIGLFLWRIESYRVSHGTAKRVNPGPDECFTFNPVGLDMHLFNQPRTESQISNIAEEHNVPALLRRLPLHNELEQYREAIALLKEDEYIQQLKYFGTNPVFQVTLNGTAIPSKEMLICNLSNWRIPENTMPYPDPDGVDTDLKISVAVDPVLGRITFPSGTAIEKVQVTYNYGFSADTGGGTYDRQEAVDGWYDPEERQVSWQIGVTKDTDTHSEAHQPELLVETLKEAVDAWHTHIQANPGTFGVIALMDNDTYTENLSGPDVIEIPEGSKLAIVAADWPQKEDPENPGGMIRETGNLIPSGLKPVIDGNISIKGTAGFNNENPGSLVLDGLLINGKITVLTGNLGELRISHCTAVPKSGGILVNGKNSQLGLALYHTISGPVKLSSWVPELCITGSLVDGNGSDAILATNTRTTMNASTILGDIDVNILEAENSILTGSILVARLQEGCVRFSFVPYGSKTPSRYKCQPELALKERAVELEVNPSELPVSEQQEIIRSVKPAFTSVIYGHHAYGQLDDQCAEEIKEGADDSSEMGVFHHLKQPQRISNLRIALKEYLNIGLKAGLIFVT